MPDPPKPRPSIPVQDPDFASVALVDRPEGHGELGDAQQLTILLARPDRTILQLGAEGYTDVGIAGETNTHIHWATSTTHTVVSLGTPPTSENSVFAGKSFLGDFTADGYAMYTDGLAGHESKLDQYMVSQEGEIVVRALAGDVLVGADQASIQVAAAKNVAITARDEDLSVTAGRNMEHKAGGGALWEAKTAHVMSSATLQLHQEESIQAVAPHVEVDANKEILLQVGSTRLRISNAMIELDTGFGASISLVGALLTIKGVLVSTLAGDAFTTAERSHIIDGGEALTLKSRDTYLSGSATLEGHAPSIKWNP